jgi:outer membrane protein assembly factor BamB
MEMKLTTDVGRHNLEIKMKALGAIVLLCSAFAGAAEAGQRLVDQEKAARLGLTRDWFTQVRVDPARNHVVRAILRGDRLTVLTSAGVVQDLNALTGATYWTAPIGNENYPSLGPAANEQFVAVVNGSTLYVLDRRDGKPVLIRPVGGAPGAAPALAEKYAIVPLVNGRIEAYSVGEKKLSPWFYQSYGKAMVSPLVTSESMVWTTDAGYLYVGNSEKLGLRFRLETGSDIVAPPSYRGQTVYVASMSGNLFAMHELSGAKLWRYGTGFPVTRSPAAVGDRVFVTSDEPALHCVDATSGIRIWATPNIVQFAAASKNRVYCVNHLGAFVVLDAASGATLAQMPGNSSIKALVNDQTDRIYLISEDGIVECLHEIGANQPVYYNPKPQPKDKAGSTDKSATPPQTQPAGTGGPPAAKPKTAPPAAQKPKGEEEKAPDKKGDAGAEASPFN